MARDKKQARFREIQRCDARDMVGCTVELARRYLRDDPYRGVVWLYLADSLSAMARYDEALQALRRAVRLCPEEKKALVFARFGHIYEQRGRFGPAERWYRRAVEAAPQEASWHIMLGALLASAGRLREAEHVHRRATRCKTGCIDEAFLNLGLVLRARGHYAEARKCFQRAIELDPKYKAAKTELSDVEHVLQLDRRA